MIKDIEIGESYLTNNSKVTLIDKQEQNGYQIFQAHEEDLNPVEQNLVADMPDGETQKVDPTLDTSEGSPEKKSILDIMKGWFSNGS
jgi:hypothetical protein